MTLHWLSAVILALSRRSSSRNWSPSVITALHTNRRKVVKRPALSPFPLRQALRSPRLRFGSLSSQKVLLPSAQTVNRSVSPSASRERLDEVSLSCRELSPRAHRRGRNPFCSCRAMHCSLRSSSGPAGEGAGCRSANVTPGSHDGVTKNSAPSRCQHEQLVQDPGSACSRSVRPAQPFLREYCELIRTCARRDRRLGPLSPRQFARRAEA